ncbi:MAG: hypothetical protein QW806_03960 [Nitrososphaerota archaeon]
MSIKRKLFSSIISGIIIGFLIVVFPLITTFEKEAYLAAPREAIQTPPAPQKESIAGIAKTTTVAATVSTTFTHSLEKTEEVGVLSISTPSFYNLYYVLFISILTSFISFIIIKKYLRT